MVTPLCVTTVANTACPCWRAAAEQYANGRLLAALSPEWKQRFEHLRDALRRLGGEVCHA